ncbi:siderophore-interacting protein [Pseudorhodoplanes sp.]|uniref:siderophore-interacting protein n=1 Tax=Pseudorhodoplanes sp. TaxID=1934341 RepID=UPI003D0AB22D
MRVLEVLRVARVTPLMQRVTLGGDELRGIPEGPNIKLVIPPAGNGAPGWPMRGENGNAVMPPGRPMPITRTYSVRRLDREAGELDVDFVMHGEGVASTWAENAKPGDKLGIGGPGGPEVRPADWYLIAGDHAALPAISRILETLPAGARGNVFVEVPSKAEEQDIRGPRGVALNWVHTDSTRATNASALERAVRASPWPHGKKIYAWLAAESSTVRSLRAYVRDERRLGKREFLAIGYWRRGLAEPEYHDKFDHDRGEDFHEAVREEHARAQHDHAH